MRRAPATRNGGGYLLQKWSGGYRHDARPPPEMEEYQWDARLPPEMEERINVTRALLQKWRRIHPNLGMVKDYDQQLNKRPGKGDAVFPWHQDMGYWPGPKALGVEETATCTFSLAVDDSTEENGCLRYLPGSGVARTLRQHAPLSGSRDEGHALMIDVNESKGDVVTLAPCMRGSVTVHDEFVVHGSSGNMSHDRQRRTYVLAYRPKRVVDAERRIGFTHSHNDVVNWDTFNDGEDRKML